MRDLTLHAFMHEGLWTGEVPEIGLLIVGVQTFFDLVQRAEDRARQVLESHGESLRELHLHCL